MFNVCEDKNGKFFFHEQLGYLLIGVFFVFFFVVLINHIRSSCYI